MAKQNLRRQNSSEAAIMLKNVEVESRRIYQLCDVENKGFITKRDLWRLEKYASLTPLQLEEVFKSLDKNSNGFLTKNDFINHFVCFFKQTSDAVESHALLEYEDRTVATRLKKKKTFHEEKQQLLISKEQLEKKLGIQTDDNIIKLYAQLRRDNPDLLPSLEEVFAKMSIEMENSRSDYKAVQKKLQATIQSQEKQIQRLVTEMEEQIQIERKQIEFEVFAKGQLLRERIGKEIFIKEHAYQELLVWKEATQCLLKELQVVQRITQEENNRLAKEKCKLEHLVQEKQIWFYENVNYINKFQLSFKKDCPQKSSTSIELSKRMEEEEMELVRQLKCLHAINYQVKLDKSDTAVTNNPSYSNDAAEIGKDRLMVDSVECRCEVKIDEDNDCECDDGWPHSSAEVMSEICVNPALHVTLLPQRVFKIVFVGDCGVGKTCVIQRFCHNRFSNYFNSTVGLDFQIKLVELPRTEAVVQQVVMQLWDTGGQERFRSLTKQYFRKADGVVIVYDVTNEQSFLSVRQWMSDAEEMFVESKVPVILLLANKCDLYCAPDLAVISDMQGALLAQSFGAFYSAVSAKSGLGVTNALLNLSRNLVESEDKELVRAAENCAKESSSFALTQAASKDNACCKSFNIYKQ